MAATGYTPIQLYYSTTAAAVPVNTNLANGELAINITDGKLYYKNNSGVVTLLAGSSGSGPAGGSNTQVQYNSSGILAGSANLTFNGTTLTAAGFSGPLNGTVGATTPNTGAFTTLSTSGALTVNTTALVSSGTNNIGINTASPLTNGATYGTLTINGSNGGAIQFATAGTSIAQIYNDNNSLFINPNTGKTIALQIASSTVASVSSTGIAVTGAINLSGTITSTVVSGQVLIAGSGTTGILYNNFTNTGGTLLYGVDNSAGNALYSGGVAYAGFVATTGATPIILSTNGSARVIVNSSGNVGVGTSTLNYAKLVVLGATSDPSLTVGTTATAIIAGASGQELAITESGTSPYAISLQARNSSGGPSGTSYPIALNPLGGFVSVGTTSPSATFEVSRSTQQTTVDTASQVAALLNTSTDTAGNLTALRFRQDNGTNAAQGLIGLSSTGSSSTRADLIFASPNVSGNATERLRIASNGAWGLAGANYGTSGQALVSNGSGSAPTWQTVGGGSAAGSNTQVQYNSSGAFAGSANFTFNGTGITTGNVNVNSATNPTNGMYLNSTSTSGLSFYNTGASGGSTAIQMYYGRSSLAATSNGVSNGDTQWFGFLTAPQLTTIGSTASQYTFQGNGYLITDVPFVYTFTSGGRGDNTTYTCPAANGVIYVNMQPDWGGNASLGHNGIYVRNSQQGLGNGDTSGVKVVGNAYAQHRNFHSLSAISDPNGGGQPYGFYAQIDTSAGANDNSAPVGLVIDNALVDNYTKTNGGAQMAIFYDRRSGSTTRTAIQFYRNTTSNSVGSITTTNSATSYNTSSDYRLKENIAPLTGAIEKVLRLKPSTYTWKVDGSAGEGFIAHELQEVIPQAVSGEKDAEKLQQVEVEHYEKEIQDENGKIIKPQKFAVFEERMMPIYQGVDSSFLVATLTAAIQEQQALIVALTARLDALEAK